MKKIIVALLSLGSLSAFAQVNLTPGTSITLSGIQVNCSGTSTSSGAAAYLNLPNSKIMEAIRTTGIGTCKVKTIDRSDFFFSPNHKNGLHLSFSMHPNGVVGFIKDEIRDGVCD